MKQGGLEQAGREVFPEDTNPEIPLVPPSDASRTDSEVSTRVYLPRERLFLRGTGEKVGFYEKNAILGVKKDSNPKMSIKRPPQMWTF